MLWVPRILAVAKIEFVTPPVVYQHSAQVSGRGVESPWGTKFVKGIEMILTILILINIHAKTLTFQNHTYPIGDGILDSRGESITPRGTFHVTAKFKNPYYYDVKGNFVAGPFKYDKRNQYGTRFIQLNKKVRGQHIGIHGTNDPSSIGADKSHSCIRMLNKDIEKIFDQIKVGDRVVIQ